MIFLPLHQFNLCVLAEVVFVFLLLGWHGDTGVSFLLKEFSCTFHLSFFLLLVTLLKLSKLSIKICLTFGESNLLTLLDHALLGNSHLVSIRKTILILTNLFGFDPFGNGYHMSIKSLNLRHEVDDLEPVVWLLCKWVPKQIKLLHKSELGNH